MGSRFLSASQVGGNGQPGFRTTYNPPPTAPGDEWGNGAGSGVWLPTCTVTRREHYGIGGSRRPDGSGASRHRRDQSTNKSRQLAGPRPDAAAAAQLRGRNEATEPVAGRALLIGRHLLEQLGARLGIATQAIEERLPHLPQTGELLIHQSQLAVHQRIGLIEMLESHVWISLAGPGVAYLLTLFFGAYQLTDFGDRESEKIAQALDALQPLDIGFRIEAVSNLGTGGRVEQADLFVIAQCSLGHPRECGHPFDADQAFCWLGVYIGLPGGRFPGCGHLA